MDAVDQRVDAGLVQDTVDETRLFRQGQIKQGAAGRGFDDPRAGFAVGVARAVILPIGPGLHSNLGVDIHEAQLIGGFDFFQAAEDAPFTHPTVADHSEVIDAENHILRGSNNRLTISRLQKVARGHHQGLGFFNGLVRQGHMNGHLVAIEVGIKGRTDKRMQLNRLALDQLRHECLDTQTVQRRRTI